MSHPIISELESRISLLQSHVAKMRAAGGSLGHYKADVAEENKNRLEQRIYEIKLSMEKAL